jgi:isopentenyldiphosphate isomerase
MTDEIILVDHRDNDIGSEEKDACHRLPVNYTALSPYLS